MAAWNDVGVIASALSGTELGTTFGMPAWKVDGRAFVWMRPLRRRDLVDLGDAAPSGEVLGATVADEGEKLALIDEDPEVFFTVPHFDGYPVVLVALERIAPDRLREVVESAWAVRAAAR